MTATGCINDGHSVGLEKEFYVVDGRGRTSSQPDLCGRVERRMRREMGAYDEEDGPKCYVDGSGPLEVVTRPCTDLGSLTDDVTREYGIASEEADGMGLYALGMGTRPGRPGDHAGLHVHVGFRDEDEARYMFLALQSHAPDILALSANSPSADGRVKDQRMRGSGYGRYFDAMEGSDRSSVVFKRHSTLEVRCMDSQGTSEEDAAVAAYIFGIAEQAKEDYANGVSAPAVGPQAEEDFERAIEEGMAATFKVDGEEVPAYRVVGDTLAEITPHLERYGCPDHVLAILADKVERRRSGADDILDIYREVG